VVPTRVVTCSLSSQMRVEIFANRSGSALGAHSDHASVGTRREETSEDVTHFRHRANSNRRPPALAPARIPARRSGRRMSSTAAWEARRAEL
jgi:type IV secretory pathway VirD2 relaxase